MTESERVAALERDGVRIVRVTYPDLHGVLRGKDVPIGFFTANAVDDGLGFCKAISTVDLQHNVVAGFEHGFRDIHVWPLPETLVRLPWSPEVAWCLADQTADGEPYGADPRATLKRAMAAFGELGLEPVMGPELGELRHRSLEHRARVGVVGLAVCGLVRQAPGALGSPRQLYEGVR